MLFGTIPDGRSVEAFHLANEAGVSARILTLGGIIQSLQAPDSHGAMADVVLGFPDLTRYIEDPAYHGTLIGRYANRIADGRFQLDGHTHDLTKNADGNTLHGGARGFSAAIWNVESAADTQLVLSHSSPDGDQGFPGNLQVRATYVLSPDCVLQLSFEARTDAPTVLNLSNHAYWNLSGADTILDHTLQIDATRFTPVNARLLPTGEIRAVAGTPFDFREPRPIRRALDYREDTQIALAGGIDHNFVLDRDRPDALVHGATLASAGRALSVWTTEPGLQVYTGNSLGRGNGEQVARHARWSGIALETQHFPNSPNMLSFPSTILRPGHTFRSQTEFRFSSPR